MKIKLLALSVSLVILCNICFAQLFEKNKETGEYYSQTSGEQYYFLEDWNDDSHLLTKKFGILDDNTDGANLAQQWIDKHYVMMKYNEDELGAAIRMFGIDNAKNSTVSLDVEILKSDKSYNSFCGLTFGRGTNSSYYEKYVFAIGKAANSEEFRYKIMHVFEEGEIIKYDKLAEGEISEWQGDDDNVNNLTVKCEGNAFNFLLNKKLLTTLTINKTDINTKYSGLWLRGKSLKVAFDNLEITGVNKYPNTKIDLPASACVNPPFYKFTTTVSEADVAFFKKVIADVDNKFQNIKEKEFKSLESTGNISYEADSQNGYCITFDMNKSETLDDAMKAANNVLYNAKQACGKNSCWELDAKNCRKSIDYSQDVYLITNSDVKKAKMRIWIIKSSEKEFDVQLSVSDK